MGGIYPCNMANNQVLKIFVLSAILSLSLSSCDDVNSDNESGKTTTVNDGAPFRSNPEKEEKPEEKFEFPKVELQKISKLKKAGEYGYSEFFYYISSNFEGISSYTRDAATPEFEIYGHRFEGGIEYETSIHPKKPIHFIETFTLPRIDVEVIKNTLSQIYPDFKFECQNRQNYCEYTSYAGDEVKNVFFQSFPESSKVGISYRNK